MSQFPNLNNKNIYVSPVRDFLYLIPDHTVAGVDLCANDIFLVYAPFDGSFFLADREEVENLERAASGQRDEGLAEFYSILQQIGGTSVYDAMLAAETPTVVNHPSQYTKMSILPNLKCNFSCAYCYSAKGRSVEEIDAEKLHAALDWFVDAQRVKSKHLTLFVSGGGEPLLSWPRLYEALRFARQKAAGQGLNLDILLMTNGSLITYEIVDQLKELSVQVGVSFEILEEIQNRNRSMYHRVADNINLLISKGLPPFISSVITAENVSRMVEMSQDVIDRFPGIKHLNFDPAMSNDLFPDADSLDAFYNAFLTNFFDAKRLCGTNGMTLDCNAIRHAEKLFPRYCQGQLCLVANGDISICHTVSSSKEKEYSTCVYGHVDREGLHFDESRFTSLVESDNYLMDDCSSCIARWHCSGGCLMYRRNYESDKFAAVCRFTRRMTGTILLSRIKSKSQ